MFNQSVALAALCAAATSRAASSAWPSLVSSASRLLLFAVPAVWLSRQPGFRLVDLWHLSGATVRLQAVLSLLLLRREFRSRLASLRSLSAASN
ncbi:MAG TPA: hypothetical protein VET86_00170 [Casimicrobiaceae bacterium]|nr:hypothetical protein [Casimicrobiaceae bacterium]